jgi:hypothetical protein
VQRAAPVATPLAAVAQVEPPRKCRATKFDGAKGVGCSSGRFGCLQRSKEADVPAAKDAGADEVPVGGGETEKVPPHESAAVYVPRAHQTHVCARTLSVAMRARRACVLAQFGQVWPRVHT